jgi:predicted glycoside hydrolase/deacetylase ChbG (UPF0249 family)
MKYYLDNPDDCVLPDENTQPDLIWALITSFAEHYKAHTDIETLKKIIKVLRRVNEEYAVFTLKRARKRSEVVEGTNFMCKQQIETNW